MGVTDEDQYLEPAAASESVAASRNRRWTREQTPGAFRGAPGGRTYSCDFVFINEQPLDGQVYLLYHMVRFKFDGEKSAELRANPKRGIGFEEAQTLWERPYYLDRRSDAPEQFRAIGWVGDKLYSIIFEVRDDVDGEYLHLVTLWRATREEQGLYEESS